MNKKRLLTSEKKIILSSMGNKYLIMLSSFNINNIVTFFHNSRIINPPLLISFVGVSFFFKICHNFMGMNQLINFVVVKE